MSPLCILEHEGTYEITTYVIYTCIYLYIYSKDGLALPPTKVSLSFYFSLQPFLFLFLSLSSNSATQGAQWKQQQKLMPLPQSSES